MGWSELLYNEQERIFTSSPAAAAAAGASASVSDYIFVNRLLLVAKGIGARPGKHPCWTGYIASYRY